MKKSSLFIIALLSFNFLISAVSNQKLTLHFETNAFELTKDHLTQLDLFLNDLHLAGDYEFFITGHTDEEGSDTYNLKLSEKRALSIGKHLKQIGVSAEYTFLNYKGEYEPLIKTFNEQRKAENRRVDIIFKKYEFSNLDELMNEMKEGNLSVFEFNQTYEQFLEGKNGVRIHVPPNSFVDKQGSSVSQVQLKLREALSMTDFIEEDLSTLSDGDLLVSGGMYQLEAFSKEGNPLELEEGSTLEVSIPNVSVDSTMSVFTSNKGENWSQTEQSPTTKFSRFNSRKRPKFSCYQSMEKPQERYVKWEKPKYQPDLASKPRKPSEPVHPKKPKNPNRDAYTVKAKWYHISSVKQRRLQAANRYKKAMENYEAAMEAFYLECPEYQIECDNYTDQLNQFYMELAIWELEENERKIKFETEYIPEQFNYWEEQTKEQRNAYSKIYALWKSENKEMLDSCRQNYKIAYKAWKSEEDSLRNIYYEKLDNLGIAPTEQDQQYLVQQAKLGWINIDRFWKFEGERSDLIVHNDDEKTNEKVIVHFVEVNSCMSIQMKKENAQLKSYPIGEPANVFAYKVENNSIYVAQHEVDGKTSVNLKYEKVRFSEFRSLLESMGRYS